MKISVFAPIFIIYTIIIAHIPIKIIINYSNFICILSMKIKKSSLFLHIAKENLHYNLIFPSGFKQIFINNFPMKSKD